MPLSIDHDYMLNTLADMVRIESINPSLTPGGSGESRIAEYTAKSMESIGLDVNILEPVPGRPTVVGCINGSNASQGRTLMLNAHYDTVGINGMADPFSATVRDGRLYGRGAYDMKGSLAACMTAAKAITDADISLSGDLLVAAVADEEYASLGTAELIKQYTMDAAIVTEPTELQLCLAHKGFIWLEVETTGRAAHGSRFDIGIDANMRMGRVLNELERLEQDLRRRPGHNLTGPPSLHAAIIQGGTEISVYSASCRLQIERRTVPGETQDQVVAEIQDILDCLAAADPTFEARVNPFFSRDPFEVDGHVAIVQKVADAAAAIMGAEPKIVGQTPWMDSALLANAGVETVVIGPAGAGAHSKEEWVDIASVEKLAQILGHAAVSYCNS